ncbi:MAG: ABC transporter ATP-binding protein [Candidatus Omnitrophica bacterium]|nr:ABC transporter ATP-binding protein [Candidatus Omnitrophota bacterium]
MLKAEGVHKIYRDGKKDLHVLKGIDLEIEKAGSLAIVGPSGAGKSTLLHILGGLDRPSSGKVFVDGSDLYTLTDSKRAGLRNKRIGFVFQFYHLLPEFTALENVMMPALITRDEGRGTKDEIRKRIKDLMTELGLEDRLHHRPSALSGGEQQRVAIGRSLINSPDMLLCDEPTGNLGSEMGEEILNLLFNLNKKNHTTVVIVTHDKEIAKRADRIVEIRDGELI